MAKHGFKIMDSDMHIIEPPDLWQRYIAPEFRDRAPVGQTRFPRDLGVSLGGRQLTDYLYVEGPASTPFGRAGAANERSSQSPKYEDGGSHGWGPDSQVRAMDREGIDLAVLFPSRALFVLADDGLEPRLAAAIAAAYNDWLAEFCHDHPGRLIGAGHLAPHDVGLAVQEARRCVEELGFKALFMRPNIVNGRNWFDPYFDPLWEECQRLNVAVGFHEGGRTPFLNQVGNQFPTSMLQHTACHSMGMMLAAIGFCGSGLLERFPRLRVAFLEANCSWAPWLMWRLDEHHEWRGYEHPDLKMPPSAYFKRQCFVSVEGDEAPAKYMEDAGYGHTVVFSTDYPHPDSKYPHAVDGFLKQDFSMEAKRRFLWDNCARLYGFE